MNRPRTFQLRRTQDVSGVSGLGIVAWGTQFPDGTVVTHWNFAITHTDMWNSIEHMISIHGHGGATVVEWLDDAWTNEVEVPICQPAVQMNV